MPSVLNQPLWQFAMLHCPLVQATLLTFWLTAQSCAVQQFWLGMQLFEALHTF
jgi:hypothetical protein